MQSGRDITWEDFLAGGAGQHTGHEPMEANEPAFILATSGTTAKPKLAVHTHGGYQVHIHTMGRWVLRPRPRRRLVVDLGHRLDRRPQLHRLRAAAGRLHDARLRGRHRPPRPRRPSTRSSRTTASPASSPRRRPCGCSCATARRRRAGIDLSVAASAWSAPARCSTPPAWEWLQQDAAARTASRSSTTCGRPRPAARSSATPTVSRMLPIKPGSAGIPLPGIETPSRRRRTASPSAPGEKGIMVIKRPFPG